MEEVKDVVKRNRGWFIREVAKRARFTQGDIRIVLDTMIEVIRDVIANGEELAIPGLFRVYVKDIARHPGFNAVKNIKIVVEDSKRIVFSASRSLLKYTQKNKD